MRYREIELKYSAENLDFSKFVAFCKERKPLSYIQAAGFDYFYCSPEESSAFARHRVGEKRLFNQLTFKRKTTDINNNIRTERNIQLAPEVTESEVAGLCSEFGYVPNGRIFKTCFIFTWEDHVLSYYICFDEEMKEMGRFIEIEANEDYNWGCDADAWNTVVALERVCKPLGLSPQARIKRSLYEMYAERKDGV